MIVDNVLAVLPVLRFLHRKACRASRRRRAPRCGSPTIALALTILSGSLHAQGIEIELVEVASGLERPVVVTDAGDGSGRLFIVEQTGKILVLEAGSVLSTPFLDLSALITGGTNEQGLLGLAFHPDYASNGTFFVDYTEPESSPPEDCPASAPCDANTVIARYQVSADDEEVADPSSAQVLFRVNQPQSNHNGGNLAFGPDGYLYIAMGDGGGGGDPYLNGQDLSILHGAILRIDVDGTPPDEPNDVCGEGATDYGIPADNPFVDQAGACDEIWAYGLRNPWRFTFDRETGDLFIGDVGQNAIEEIDVQDASSPGGENYGWNCYEGSLPYPGGQTCSGPLVFPVLEYPHSNPSDPDNTGRSVTGGYRYRGAAHPELDGVYFYADFVFGRIWGTMPRCDGVWESRLLRDESFLISTFGEGADGELFLTDFRTGNPTPTTSRILRLQPATDSGGPALVASPAALDFGSDVQVGTSSARDLLITNGNAGPEALLVDVLTLSDPSLFSIDPSRGTSPCGSTTPCLGPGESCSVSIVFTPTATGAVTGSLTASGNSDPETVDLSGSGITCSAGSTRVVTGGPITDARTDEACVVLAAGPYEISHGGDVVLRAGQAIELRDGFSVSGNGQLEAGVDAALLP